MFLLGFREAIRLTTVVAIPYLLLSLVVLVRGLVEIAARPELWSGWHRALEARGDWGTIAAGALLVFALGMSGFETGVSVMPLIDGDESDAPPRRGAEPRVGRIHNTCKLLVAAAAIMSVMLLLSSIVTTLLISPDDYREGGPASGRALAHLAHGFFSAGLASLYDISTILVLWLAGASAMAGLLNLVPRYLPRFGMAPAWAARARPLVLVLFVINVLVTLVFRASVEAQSGAYATGVLALILDPRLRLHTRRQLCGAAGRGDHRERVHPPRPRGEHREPVRPRHGDPGVRGLLLRPGFGRARLGAGWASGCTWSP
jgi:hypothetical protein